MRSADDAHTPNPFEGLPDALFDDLPEDVRCVVSRIAEISRPSDCTFARRTTAEDYRELPEALTHVERFRWLDGRMRRSVGDIVPTETFEEYLKNEDRLRHLQVAHPRTSDDVMRNHGLRCASVLVAREPTLRLQLDADGAVSTFDLSDEVIRLCYRLGIIGAARNGHGTAKDSEPMIAGLLDGIDALS